MHIGKRVKKIVYHYEDGTTEEYDPPQEFKNTGHWSTNCRVCGNRFEDMTHYVCNDVNCPTRIT